VHDVDVGVNIAATTLSLCMIVALLSA
jgi:hypothetical protein